MKNNEEKKNHQTRLNQPTEKIIFVEHRIWYIWYINVKGVFFLLLDIIQEKCRNRDEKIVCLRMFVNNIFIIFFFCCLVSVYVRVYSCSREVEMRRFGYLIKGLFYIHYDGRLGARSEQVTYKHVYEGRFFFCLNVTITITFSRVDFIIVWILIICVLVFG